MSDNISSRLLKRHDDNVRKIRLDTSRDSAESKLTWQLVTRNIQGCLSKNLAVSEYPYVYDYQWMPVDGHTDHGVGDLVLTDGQGRFAVVEIKYLDWNATGATARTRRQQHKTTVKQQAMKYLLAWKQQHPYLDCRNVIGCAIFNSSRPNEFEEHVCDDTDESTWTSADRNSPASDDDADLSRSPSGVRPSAGPPSPGSPFGGLLRAVAVVAGLAGAVVLAAAASIKDAPEDEKKQSNK